MKDCVTFGTIDDDHVLNYSFDDTATDQEVTELKKKCDRIIMSYFLGREYDGETISTGKEHTVRFRGMNFGAGLAAAQDIACLLKTDLDLF